MAAVDALPKPVSLDEIKAEPRLAEMALVKFSRLSVQPVTEKEWQLVCAMGGMKKAPTRAPASVVKKPATLTKAAKEPAAPVQKPSPAKTVSKTPAKPAKKSK